MKKLILLGILFAATRVFAVTPVPFTEAMDFHFKVDGNGTSHMTVFDEAGMQRVFATASGSEVESDYMQASLRPGKSYALQFWGLDTTDYSMSFVAPTGYTVYVNGVATNLVTRTSGGGWYLHFYTLEIRPTGSDAGRKWGEFSGIALGKSITWEVGLGDLRTGRGAGSILFKELDLSGSPASADRLYYAAPPANVGQIVVVRDGPNQTLRQICTPIGFTDIVDAGSGYEIRFYHWAQVDEWNGSRYEFLEEEEPWKKIIVESPGDNHLRVTEEIGSVIMKVSDLVGSGSTTATGGTITYSGSSTVHLFTSGGTFTTSGPLSGASWLVVGGGGGGGSGLCGGGGGAGSVEYMTGQTIAANTYTVVVGNGGGADANGANSSFNGTIGYGGGYGASNTVHFYASPGGSGGGGNANQLGAAAGSGSNVNQGGGGDNGGAGWSGGGGGGAGGNTQNPAQGGGTYNGGNGLTNSITGSAVTYGGGGGGGYGTRFGGTGGGGNGGLVGAAGGSGQPNTGGGGGGSGVAGAGTGGSGGSGVVIVRYPTPSMIWTLKEGDGNAGDGDAAWLRTTTHTSSVPEAGKRDVVVVVRTGDSTGTIVSQSKFRYKTQAWGEELESIVVDADGNAGTTTDILTTSYEYHTDDTKRGNYRKIKSVTSPNEGWVAYEYYDDWETLGQLKHQFQPWLNTPSAATGASLTTGRVISYLYSANSEDWTGRYTRPTTRNEYITTSSGTILVGKTEWVHGDVTGDGEPRSYMTIKSYRDGSNFHSDYVESYRADADPDMVGRLYQSKAASLAQVSGSISRGTFNTSTKDFTVSSTGDHWRELRFNGSHSSTDAQAVTAFNGQSCPSVYMIPGKSTVEVTIRIAQGYVYRTETWVYDGSNTFAKIAHEDFEYDAYGNLTQRWVNSDPLGGPGGALTSRTFVNGLLTATVDPTGIENGFTYDDLGRIKTSTKKADDDIVTTHTYDGANRVTQVDVLADDLYQHSYSYYDLAGRLKQSIAPGGYTTDIEYEDKGRKVRTILPGGAEKVTETYPDGQLIKTTGLAVVEEHVTYVVNAASGTVTREVLSGPTATSTFVVKTTGDWLGRPLTEVRTGGDGNPATKSWQYGNSGQLLQLSQPGMANTLFVYDTMGALVRQGLDIGAGHTAGNGTLEPESLDRITDHASSYFKTLDGKWWLRQSTTTYATDNNATPNPLGRTETQLTGLPANRLSRVDQYDIYDNVTSQWVEVNRSTKTVTTTTDAPDSATNAVQVVQNGLTVSTIDKAGVKMTFGYDALGRPKTSTDPRTGTSTTTYVAGTSLVATVTDANNVTQATYAYEDETGRVSSIVNALNKVGYFSYTTRGEKFREWGQTTTPVEYSYDDLGRMKTMKTFRGGVGWTDDEWPGTGGNAGASPGTADITTWNYNPSSGLLTSKTDAANKSVDYTYTNAGQIYTRKWVRIQSGSDRVTATYAYSPTTGELTGVDYTGTTPDLGYTYNRLGKIATVSDATGTRTFNYNLDETLELESEVLPAYFESRIITSGYATAGVIGRPDALKLGTSGNLTADQSVAYGYDTFGRFDSLTAAGQAFTYAYADTVGVTNSYLIAKTENTYLGYADVRVHDPKRNLVDSRETKWGTDVKAKFAYLQDNLGRITDVTKTGEVFSPYGPTGAKGLKTGYGYNDRSEVTSENTADLDTSPAAVTGRQDAYAYDTIGNRSTVTKTRPGGDAGPELSFSYNSPGKEVNSLNQYLRRTVPGTFDVAVVSTASSVTVDGGAMVKQGEYFFRGHPLNNSSGPVFDPLTITGRSEPFEAFLPDTDEDFTYDDDGNLTRDGRWVYVYDAENRLKEMFTRGAPEDPLKSDQTNKDVWDLAMPKQKLEFTYDYLGRRVRKVAKFWDTTQNPDDWTIDTDEKFIWSGWNLMAKIHVTATTETLVASYYWGLDLSGSLQSAGGVGGLLMTSEGGQKYLPIYDAMGNVHGMIKASDGSIAAAYEYDAFGNTLRESGGYAGQNPFRYSTKYTDIETGLVYYGLRYYSPSLGRFTNKDPIAESGGRNLYAFCGNSGVNSWDYLGMDPIFVFTIPGSSGTGSTTGGSWGGITFTIGGSIGSFGAVSPDLSGNWKALPGYIEVPGEVVNYWLNEYTINGFSGKIRGKVVNGTLVEYRFNSVVNRWLAWRTLGTVEQKDNAPTPDASVEPWTEVDLFNHYYNGMGRGVNLSSIGLLDEIKNASITREKVDAFRRQIYDKARSVVEERGAGQFSIQDAFRNSYQFGKVRWVIGSATLGGQFSGAVIANADGTFRVEGTWGFYFFDDFKDGLDAGNWFSADLEVPGATPFVIGGQWTEPFIGGDQLWDTRASSPLFDKGPIEKEIITIDSRGRRKK